MTTDYYADFARRRQDQIDQLDWARMETERQDHEAAWTESVRRSAANMRRLAEANFPEAHEGHELEVF